MGCWRLPAPGGAQRVQSGVTRVVLLIAPVAMPRSRPRRTGPPPAAPPTPKMGSAGQAGISMQAVCRPCPATRPLPGGCADSAVCPPPNTPPGLGVTLCPPPEMEALTPPLFLELLARRARRPALCPATLPCAGVTACPPPHLLGPPARVPCPDKGGAAPEPRVGTPPPLFIAKGNLSIERYIFLSLF